MTPFTVTPNSRRTATDGIDRTVQPMGAVSPVPIEDRTLAEGPKDIEPQAHVDGVVTPLLAHCADLEDRTFGETMYYGIVDPNPASPGG